MAARRNSVNTRMALIDSAVDVTRRSGSAALTLDAVAENAGVSKGGLLYHFPDKQSLIEAMIEVALDRFEADVDRLAARESNGPGGWLRAFVKLTFAAEPEHDPGVSLMAAAAINPELLAPVRHYFARWQQRACSDGLEPVFASIVRLAADGLWFADLFDAAAPEGKLRESILHRLLDMIADAEASVVEG